MILIKSFVLLAIAISAHAQAQNVPGGMGTGMRMHKRHDPSVKKRIADAVARLEHRSPLNISVPAGPFNSQDSNSDGDGGSSSTSQQPTTTATSQTPDPPPPSSTSTTTTPTPTPTPTPNPPTTTTTTTSSTPTTTSTTSTSSSTTSTSTTTSSTSSGAAVIDITRTSQDTYAGISFAITNSLPLTASQTSNDDAPTDTSDGSGGSSGSKVAIAATATVAALVALGALIFLGYWWKKKSQRGRMGEDTWDEASMKEFSHGAGVGAPIVAPPPVARNLDLDDELGGVGAMPAAGGLGRSNTKVLPSQSAYAGGGAGTALARSRSQHTQEVYEEEPDELLAMPPVAHYERPRDSAYDIVPAAPPANAYAPTGGYGFPNAAPGGSGGGGYAGYGTSGGLAPPHRKGDHTSYGSGIGHDPFAGSGFVDASRESTYGPGQAGRGAGGAGGPGAPGVQGPGNQWPQGYNPYTGYSQGSQAPYGQAGYGYAS